MDRKLGGDAPYRYEINMRVIVGADGLDAAERTRLRLQEQVRTSHGMGVVEVTSTVRHRNDLDGALGGEPRRKR